ncbi:hypothetical protein D0Z08_11045 [Nocardioides immobilis]|uniref:Uncharacterized protein n=1 Tax=Nocardioides immobilis TaxID=2049295 RepID=A0A417Y3F5_9ACTN|nr:hypothetical protein [Nocardioides immobilis]RHW27190.1 hypothetical protein D0Z08_11045 [Nocardioides immobilis]
MSDLVLRRIAALLLALLAVGGLAASAAADPAATLTEPYVPPADTIVHVEGDAANGFSIEHYDGSWEFPPTDSETTAECNEYDRLVRRIRCRVSTRTWYRALAGFRETTDYYRSLL